jgi:hypothetical protein
VYPQLPSQIHEEVRVPSAALADPRRGACTLSCPLGPMRWNPHHSTFSLFLSVAAATSSLLQASFATSLFRDSSGSLPAS